MNCKDFEHWLLTRDVFTDIEKSDVREHLENCESCKNIYMMDTGLEVNIKLGFHRQELPRGLFDKVDSNIDQAKRSILKLPSCFMGKALPDSFDGS